MFARFLSCKLSCNYIPKKMMGAKYLLLLGMILFSIYSCQGFSLKLAMHLGWLMVAMHLMWIWKIFWFLQWNFYRCSSTRGIQRCMPGSNDDLPACEKHFWQGCCWLQNQKPWGMQIVMMLRRIMIWNIVEPFDFWSFLTIYYSWLSL